MSSEVKVSVGLGEIINKVVSSIFTGSPLDAVIAVLLIMIAGLCFLSWRLHKNNEENKKRADEIIKESNKQMLALTEKYSSAITELQEKQTHEVRIMNNSLEAAKVILAEVKVLLSFVVSQPRSDK